MPKAEETILEIDLRALAHNYKVIRSQLTPDVKFMGVIKAYAYGNDSVQIAKKLEELGADYLAVAYTSEGIALRKAGIPKPILIFHPQKADLREIIDNCLEPSLYSNLILKKFIATATELKQENYPVHLKFNTGMNRLGFSAEELPEVLKELSGTSVVKIASAFSHLAASADWREREFTLEQISNFRKIAFNLTSALPYQPIMHICNTSAIFNYPEAAFNMVRSGIGLYGFANDENLDKKLRPVGTLKTVISQIQVLKEGNSLGYNRSFKATKPTKTATLPLGYADGIDRKYGNKNASVLINGEYAPIIGNVCMDITMIDITGIDCDEGDEVIIFGAAQKASTFAKAANTISYELIAGISQRVKRKIIP